jgi:hypothetical protein
LALFQERKVKPHRADNATRWLMAALSQLFDWRSATHRGIIKALNAHQLQGGLQLEF